MAQARHPPGPPMTLGNMGAPMEIDFLVEELNLLGIQFQVWHFIYLGIGAVALIHAKLTGR
jgi:hypothetical protein